MSTLLTHPNELTTDEVVQLILSSSGSDWLFFTEEKVFSYRHNLLVRIEAETENLAEKCTIRYGAEPVGSVYVLVDNRSLTLENCVNVRITGDVEISLINVERIENSQYEDYLTQSTAERARRALPYRRPRPAAVGADFQSR